MKIRIAVIVDKNGVWSAQGWGDGITQAGDEGMKEAALNCLDECDETLILYFIEAEIDPPKEETIRGKVSPVSTSQ